MKKLPQRKNMKNFKNMKNIGQEKGGWENPLATRSARSPIWLQTPHNSHPDPLPLLLELSGLALVAKVMVL